MPVASSTGWVGSRVTPAPGHVQGWSLAPPSPPCTEAARRWCLCLHTEVLGSSWCPLPRPWPPPSRHMLSCGRAQQQHGLIG